MMSIALERSSTTSNRIEGSGFIRGYSSCLSNFESTADTGSRRRRSSSVSSGIFPGDQRFPSSSNMASIKEPEELDSCSSSSIGRNSDLSRSSMDSDGEDDAEVQSSFKGPLDTMDALEEVLPIRRGISKFYCGKSKSFTSLADSSSTSSVKDLAKPDNAYTRKRKNLLACSNILEKNRNTSPPLSRSSRSRSSSSSGSSNIGGISKRPTNSYRSTLAMGGGGGGGVGTSSSESCYNTSEENSNSSSLSPRLLPPLHPPQAAKSSLNNAAPLISPPQHKFSSWRSFSLTDLQGAADSSVGSSIGNRDGNRDEPLKKLN